MSGLPMPLPPGRQRELAVVDALADLDAEIDLLRDALPKVNDPAMRPGIDQLAAFASTAGEVLANHAGTVDQRLVDALADLLGTVRLVRLPARDPEFGFTVGLKEVRGAQGQIVLTLGNTLAAAAELGLRPSQPASADTLAAEVPRALFEGRLTEIADQLDVVVERLDALDAARQAAPGTAREAGLVGFYLGAMRVEVHLALLSLTVGDSTIDFAALARATEAMASLTGDFLATLRAWAERATAAIRQAAEQLRAPMRRVVTGVRAAARFVAGKVARGSEGGPSEVPVPEFPQADPVLPADFSEQAVRDLILAGKAVPAAWVPFVTTLDFRETRLADLTPLTGLTALQGLYLSRTQVSDLTPLAGLTALQRLDITGTKVTDVSVLRHLSVYIDGGPESGIRGTLRRLFGRGRGETP